MFPLKYMLFSFHCNLVCGVFLSFQASGKRPHFGGDGTLWDVQACASTAPGRGSGLRPRSVRTGRIRRSERGLSRGESPEGERGVSAKSAQTP